MLLSYQKNVHLETCIFPVCFVSLNSHFNFESIRTLAEQKLHSLEQVCSNYTTNMAAGFCSNPTIMHSLPDHLSEADLLIQWVETGGSRASIKATVERRNSLLQEETSSRTHPFGGLRSVYVQISSTVENGDGAENKEKQNPKHANMYWTCPSVQLLYPYLTTFSQYFI